MIQTNHKLSLSKQANLLVVNRTSQYRKPFTSPPNKEHKKYPYLLKKLSAIKINQVWVSDIIYIKVAEGLVYLSVVMDWASRKILDWELSNTMDVFLCVDPLKCALGRFSVPEIINTEQGSQYTSEKFTSTLMDAQIKISMDGKGRWKDNVMIERFWRTIKYEEVYPKRYETLKEAKMNLKNILNFTTQIVHIRN